MKIGSQFILPSRISVMFLDFTFARSVEHYLPSIQRKSIILSAILKRRKIE